MMTYNTGNELFDRVFENSLNDINPEALTKDEIETHENWVNENWNELMNYDN